MNERDCSIYLITPSAIDDPAVFADDLAAALDAGSVACVQLRLKGASDGQVLAAAAALMPVCHEREVAFLINDRPDLALTVDADGVHIGAEDGTIEEARDILGHDRSIGYTCKDSVHMGYEAGEAGANYVAFGAFFPTETKETTASPDPEILETWSEVTEIPCVAIGGITAENCGPLVRAGAHFLAVCSYVWDHPDGPAAAVIALDKAIHDA